MATYDEYLPELRTASLFCDMTDAEILLVLNAMQPPIKKGPPQKQKMANGEEKLNAFRMVLRSHPVTPLAPRYFKYDMPKFGEPGMLMAEIPALSRMQDYVVPHGRPHSAPGRPKHTQEIETLEFTPDMITAFYSSESAPAQGKMLRNFLGILAQKVCDIRQELFLLRDGRDMYAGLTLKADKVLHIRSAGVAANVVKKAVRLWNAMHPELPAECIIGGSVDLIHQVKDGAPCDVLVMADETLIKSMLMPDYVTGYRLFAGNKMVVMGSEENPISRDDWQEKLLAPDATFGHFSPWGDPGGYRAVMAMLLAEKIHPGLSNKLMQHPGHKGMARQAEPEPQPAMYTFGYYSMAVSRNLPFAELPPEMDLSAPELAETYATAVFAINADTTVTGAPIAHAVTIPVGANNPDSAKAFCQLFMQSDFSTAGFITRSGVYGKDPLV